MEFLHDAASLRAGAHTHPDGAIRELLHLRIAQFDRADHEEIASFIVVDEGDPADAVEAALGWPILTDLDGVRFPSRGFQPSSEWIADHGCLYELYFALSDGDGDRVVLVPKRTHIDRSLLALCRRFAVPAP